MQPTRSLEDITLMRALPNMTVIVPADAAETKAAVKWAASYKGPVYIRMGRAKCEDIMPDDKPFVPGKSTTLRDGNDVTFITCGIMTAKALRAAETLEKQGISARVINMSSVKPIDEEAIVKAAEETGAIVTAEEHTVKGGLGGAVAEVLALKKPCLMDMVGTEDTFGQSGKADELLEVYGLTAEHLVSSALHLISRK